MARVSIRPNVGYKRTPASVRGSLRAVTSDARAQMRQIQKNLENLIGEIEGVTPEAVEYALQPIYDKSQQYCPVDTGKLKESGYIEVRQKGDRIEGEVGYGKRGNPFYAPYVHEMVDLYHEPPTQAKFLERAVNEHQDEILPRLISFIRRRVGL